MLLTVQHSGEYGLKTRRDNREIQVLRPGWDSRIASPDLMTPANCDALSSFGYGSGFSNHPAADVCFLLPFEGNYDSRLPRNLHVCSPKRPAWEKRASSWKTTPVMGKSPISVNDSRAAGVWPVLNPKIERIDRIFFTWRFQGLRPGCPSSPGHDRFPIAFGRGFPAGGCRGPAGKAPWRADR